MYRLLKYLSAIILSFSLMILFSFTVKAIGVQPLTLDFSMSPGETEDFQLIFSSSGIAENVAISIYQCYQDYTGNLGYRLADQGSFPEMGWIELEENSVQVPGEGEVYLKGSIRVPFGTQPGSYIIILMVEPEPGKAGDGISLLVRYAVRLIVRVDGPVLRERGRINFLRLDKDENGEPLIIAGVENTSRLDYLAGVEVTIRDENRSLVERVTLRTIFGVKNNRDLTRLYPGSEVLFLGKPENYLFPGNYELRAVMSYGERGKASFIDNIGILPGQFKEPARALNEFLSIKPEMIDFRLEPGQRLTETIEITNISRERVYIKTELLEIGEDNNSLLPWLRLYADERLVLMPRQSRKLLNILQLPLNVERGGYYALVNLKVFQDESMLNLLDEQFIPVCCLVGEDSSQEIKIKGFEFNNEGEQKFFLPVKNTGQVHLKPAVKLTLWNNKEELMEEIELDSADLIGGILFPGGEALYKGNLKKKLERGEYEALIEVKDENDSIQIATYRVFIE